MQQKTRLNNVKRLNYIMRELSQLEKQYSTGLLRLKNCCCELKEIGTLGDVLDNFTKSFQLKAESHMTYAKSIETLIDHMQYDLTENCQSNFYAAYDREEQTFQDVLLKLDNAKEEYHKCFNDNEKILMEDITPAMINGKNDKFNKKKEIFINNEQQARKRYCDIINQANNQRETYIEKMNQLFNECERFDQENMIKLYNHKIISLIKAENVMLDHSMKLNTDLSDVCSKINPGEDIKLFCLNNHRHGHPPNKFDFVVFKQDFNFPSLPKETKESNELNINDFIKQFFKAFKYYPPLGEIQPELVKKYTQIEDFAVDAWMTKLKPQSMKILKELFEVRELRLHFLKCINNFRMELFPLTLEAFNHIVELMVLMLSKSQGNPIDYEVIKFVIILSQTFYRENHETNNMQYYLQNEIMKEDLWKKRETWEGLIDYSYEMDLLGAPTSKKCTMNDKIEDRITKEQNTMSLTLYTFKFIMKCFGYGMKKIDEILKYYHKKYNMNEGLCVFDKEEVEALQKEITSELNQPTITIVNTPELINQVNNTPKDI